MRVSAQSCAGSNTCFAKGQEVKWLRNDAFRTGSTKGAMRGKSSDGELSFNSLAKSCINKQVCT